MRTGCGEYDRQPSKLFEYSRLQSLKWKAWAGHARSEITFNDLMSLSKSERVPNTG